MGFFYGVVRPHKHTMIAPPPSKDQIALALLLKLDIGHDSRDVAAAKLLDTVAVSLGFEPAEPASDRQRAFAESLGASVDGITKRVASARIGELLMAKNMKAIDDMNLKPGDHVVRIQSFEFQGETRVLEQEFVISSVQPNGRVFFKGGNGQGAWPTQLRKSAA